MGIEREAGRGRAGRRMAWGKWGGKQEEKARTDRQTDRGGDEERRWREEGKNHWV